MLRSMLAYLVLIFLLVLCESQKYIFLSFFLSNKFRLYLPKLLKVIAIEIGRWLTKIDTVSVTDQQQI